MRTLVAIFVFALASGCGPHHAPSALAPARGQRIAVVEFSVNGAQIAYDGSSQGFGLAVAEAAAADLRKRGYDAEAVPAGREPRGDLIVRGRIIRLDEGSRALRYFVSFGAGGAALSVAGDVTRADGKPVGSFADERRSGFGIFGGSGESLLQRDLHEIGEDVGEMIALGDYELHH